MPRSQYRVTDQFARAMPLIAAVFVFATASLPASAQNFFDFLFGAFRPDSGNSSGDANSRNSLPEFGDRSDPGRSGDGSSTAFCVRLCDGRFFPIQRSSGANVTQACSSACPAARTKLFWGSEIGYSSANDGGRYRDLPAAFAYRDRLVAGCTCNGTDTYGLVTGNVSDDPTLRPGDVVATERGFLAYTGGRGSGEFTPVDTYGGLGAELRRRLAGTQIVPRNSAPMPARETGTSGEGQRVQLDR